MDNMINKIVCIKGIGHFENYEFSATKDGWDGKLKKVNVIYAPNGSGKTTLSTILKSLNESSLMLSKYKHTFHSDESAYLKLITDSVIEYKDDSWSSSLSNLEVFDINFIEDYLFMGSVTKTNNKTNLFKLILGERGSDYKRIIKDRLRKIQRLELRNPQSVEEKEELEEEIKEEKSLLDTEIKLFDNYSKTKYKKFIKAVNENLKKFTTYIKLSEISHDDTTPYEMFRIYMIFDVYGERVKFCLPATNQRIISAKYALSEGDKSTIALGIFLSRFTLEGTEKKIIVFDDPLSSFDYNRRSATITQLSILANDSAQFFLLTHDLHFAYDFYVKNSFQYPISLQIRKTRNGSRLSFFDIQKEYMDITRRNLCVLKDFRDSGNATNLIDVVRSIRPALEGVIKIKYFDEIESNYWLGTIIERIANANPTDRINKLKRVKEKLIQLNDYTQDYHHDSGNGQFLNPNIEELKSQVSVFFEALDEI